MQDAECRESLVASRLRQAIDLVVMRLLTAMAGLADMPVMPY
jgi:hypothetical protein